MFNFFKRSEPRAVTIRQALVQSGLAAATDPERVIVEQYSGRYSGRQVTFFRAFESGHTDVLLGSGHVEAGGIVMVDSRREAEAAAPIRAFADRAKHGDDERLVFWDALRSNTSEEILSAPAAMWQQARSTKAKAPSDASS